MDHLTRLLLDARDGDERALERFVSRTQGDVWKLCRYLGDARDADDLAQEVYERAIRSLHRYRAEGPARGWLLTIARRVCADHARSAQRRRRRDAAVFDTMVAGAGIGTLTSGDAADRVAMDAVLECLGDDRREAFVLTQVLGLHYDEAADVLGCPVGTIRSRVARARLELVDMMTDDTATDDTATDDTSNHQHPTGTDGPPRAT
ncbi:MAG: sigma-70 family RNA polymerase sigma factor [Ilumatobacter sp.]